MEILFAVPQVKRSVRITRSRITGLSAGATAGFRRHVVCTGSRLADTAREASVAPKPAAAQKGPALHEPRVFFIITCSGRTGLPDHGIEHPARTH